LLEGSITIWFLEIVTKVEGDDWELIAKDSSVQRTDYFGPATTKVRKGTAVKG